MGIGHLLTDTIYVASATAVSADGEYTYGSPAAVLAKVQPGNVESSSGNSQQAQTTARIITTTAITRTDRVWLPGDSSANNDLAHTPESIIQATGISGA